MARPGIEPRTSDLPVRCPTYTFVSPSAFSRRAVVSYWRKYLHEVLVNRLGGLSLPRKSVVRLTDRPDMTSDVYRGRKTTIQPMKLLRGFNCDTRPGCPKAAFLFWFFDDFRCGVPLFIVIFVIY